MQDMDKFMKALDIISKVNHIPAVWAGVSGHDW
jgi:hypothetical protein